VSASSVRWTPGSDRINCGWASNLFGISCGPGGERGAGDADRRNQNTGLLGAGDEDRSMLDMVSEHRSGMRSGRVPGDGYGSRSGGRNGETDAAQQRQGGGERLDASRRGHPPHGHTY
jgi:hypothetical protein